MAMEFKVKINNDWLKERQYNYLNSINAKERFTFTNSKATFLNSKKGVNYYLIIQNSRRYSPNIEIAKNPIIDTLINSLNNQVIFIFKLKLYY